MKKVIFLTIALAIASCFLLFGQAEQPDSATVTTTVKISDQEKTCAGASMPHSQAMGPGCMCKNCKCKICTCGLISGFEYFLVMLPTLLLTLVFLGVIVTMKRSKFDSGDRSRGFFLHEALSEAIPYVMTVENKNTYKMQEKKGIAYKSSSSRMLVFLSGVTSIVMMDVVATYYIYAYFKNGVHEVPDFGSILTWAATLGIGVLPYITNKLIAPSNNNHIVIPDQH